MAAAGKPVRWENNLEMGIHACWAASAMDRAEWRKLAKFSGSILWGRLLARAPAKMWVRDSVPMASSRRDACIPRTCARNFGFALCGDNLQVIEDVQGVWANCKDKFGDIKCEIRFILHAAQLALGMRPWPGQTRLLHHRRRHLNQQSDALANHALDVQRVVSGHCAERLDANSSVVLCFDGAARDRGAEAATGGCVWVFNPGLPPRCVAVLGVPIGSASSVQAEYTAALFVLLLFFDWVRIHHPTVKGRSQEGCVFLRPAPGHE
jgi:ribonuclease HI